jgi:Ca2+-binding EF-hand superfamily protein
MRTLLGASLVFLFATTAVAQFANNPANRAGKRADADPPKAADKAADPAPTPAADAAAGAPNAIFAALDADGDGVISKLELRKAITALKKLDADNDGNITLAECGGGAAAPPVAGQAAAADPWIDRIMSRDKNGDGKLTVDELNENEKQMLQGADQNGDGAVDRQELAAMENARNNNNVPGGQQGVGPGNAGIVGSNNRRGNEAMGRFFQMDRNHDGKLTTDEVPAGQMGMLKGGDLNGDGAIDASELQQLSARMGDRMKAFAAGVDPAAVPGAQNRKPPRN